MLEVHSHHGCWSVVPAPSMMHAFPPVAPMTLRRVWASLAAMGPGQQIVTPTFLLQHRAAFINWMSLSIPGLLKKRRLLSMMCV
jgi:hypothetical protein